MLKQIDLSRTDLNLLVLFETVMATRHVGQAAAALNLSPSAVSHGLGRLRRLLNDPLFLRTPRGVVPTARALELQPLIGGALAEVRGVLSVATPFDPAGTTRQFRLGIPDATLAVFGPQLIGQIGGEAPGARLSLIHVLPSFRSSPEDGAWAHVLAQLEERSLDLAVIAHFSAVPLPPRFHALSLGVDRLVAICRRDHPFARDPSLDRYCEARHVLMSQTGDLTATSDHVLKGLGRSRDVVASVPGAMLALQMAAATDLVATVPLSVAKAQADRLGLVAVPIPFPVSASPLFAVVTRAARADAGIAWLQDLVVREMAHGTP